MVRRCAIQQCTSTDLTILSHRFPRQERNAEVWRQSLGITDISMKDLLAKYVVCTLHFNKSDYRNVQSNCLNTTAVPTAPIFPLKSEQKTVDENDENYVDYVTIEKEISTNNNEIVDFEQENAVELSEGTEIIQIADDSEELPENIEDISSTNELDKLEDYADWVNYEQPRNKRFKLSREVYRYLDIANQLNTESDSVSIIDDEEPEIFDNDVIEEEEDDDDDDDDNDGPSSTLNIAIDDQYIYLNIEKSPEIKNVEVSNSTTLIQNNSETNEIINIDENNEIDEKVGIVKVAEEEQEEDEGEYSELSRKEIIEKLSQANCKILELETKLETIQQAQNEMAKSMDAFKKLFNQC